MQTLPLPHKTPIPLKVSRIKCILLSIDFSKEKPFRQSPINNEIFLKTVIKEDSLKFSQEWQLILQILAQFKAFKIKRTKTQNLGI